MKETGLHCAACGKQTLHRQETPNHILHFLITFFTCGLWAIVWLVDSGKQRPWRCTFCGTVNEVPVPPVAPAAPRPASQPMTRAMKRVLIALAFSPVFLVGAVILWLWVLGPIMAERERTERVPQAIAEAREKFGKVDAVIVSSGGAYLLKSRPGENMNAEDKGRNHLGFMVNLTAVLVLDERGPFVLIGPLEGSMKGKVGWVERDQIRRFP